MLIRIQWKAPEMTSKTQKENGKENCKAKKTYKGYGGGKEDSPGAWQ